MVDTRRPLIVRYVLAVFLIAQASPVFGEAFRILDQGAAATGQGGAFAAQADDPSALFYNPAGMTQLPGVQVYFGSLIVGGNISFTSPTGQEVQGNFDGTIVNPPPVNFYLTANVSDLGFNVVEGLTVGIGVNTPFGLLVNYPTDSPFATVATSAALPLIDIKPTVAFKLNDYISVGAGIDIYTFTSLAGEGGAEGRRIAGPAFAAIGITPGSTLEFNGRDTSLGFNFSALFTPLRNSEGKPLLSMAFVYRNGASLDLDGVFLDDGALFADATVELNLPHVVTGGLAFWPIRDHAKEWKLEVDLDYADWTSFQNLNINLSNGIVLPRPRNWGDSFVIKSGTEYTWLGPASLPNWDMAIRGGYIYSKTPVPEVTFEPTVPDSNYHAISVGLGLTCQGEGRFLGLIQCGTDLEETLGIKAIVFDLAYKARLYEDRTINNNRLPNVNGTWDTIIQAGAINLGFKF